MPQKRLLCLVLSALFGGESVLLDNWRLVLVDAGQPPELEAGDVGPAGAFLACACIALSCSKVLPRSCLGIRLGSTLGALSSVYWRSGMGKPAALAASIAFSSAFCFKANSACTVKFGRQHTHAKQWYAPVELAYRLPWRVQWKVSSQLGQVLLPCPCR